MGIFSSKKKVYVASVVYNLAGDELERPDYLKSVVASATVSKQKRSMAEAIRNGYQRGPGIQLRSFYNWADHNYGLIGMPSSNVANTKIVNTILIEQVPHAAGETVVIDMATQDMADISYWAEQWMGINHPSLLNTDWVSDYDGNTGEIIITFADTSTARFVPTGFDRNAEYLFVAYRIKTGSSYSGPKMFIYKEGSGNTALDSLIVTSSGTGQYYPTIPVRIKNKFLSSTYFPDEFELASKAYKKLTGSKMKELQDKIADNEKLGDIDHAYVVVGVSLNVKENACRQYIYRYFRKLMDIQGSGEADYDSWLANQQNFADKLNTWQTWSDAQADPANPLYGTPEPLVPNYPTSNNNSIIIEAESVTDFKYRIKLEWQSITEVTGTGLRKPEAKPGEVWFDNNSRTETSWFGRNLFVDVCRLNWQVTDNSWKSLIIVGMVHNNYVYDGKYVEIGTNEALADTDESGFIVPLHYPTYKEMGLIAGTQMSTACIFVVFNCYKVVKVKWYQRGIFRIVITIVIVVAITLLTQGAGTPGILGANLAVGSALGLSGVAAVIAGAIANALAAMIITQIIQMGAVAVFGDKIGAIIGAVMSFVAMQFGTSVMNGMSVAQAWGNMMSAQNLLMLTNSVAGGVKGYMQAATMEMVNKTTEMIESYEEKGEEITQAYIKEFGLGQTFIDPLLVSDYTPEGYESEGQFLSRTLMTGSDIADMSLGMIGNFSELTLRTDLPM